MLTFLSGKISERKLRLFAVACCRRLQGLLVHPVSRQAVEVAEQFADGLTSVEELVELHRIAEDVWVCLLDTYTAEPLDPDNEFHIAIHNAGIRPFAAEAAAGAAAAAVGQMQGEVSVVTACAYAAEAIGWLGVSGDYCDAEAEARERGVQAALLRDIVGPLLFRQITLNHCWRTPAVVGLAKSINQERRFDDLPILGDALEESGCDNEDVLRHCRQETVPHVHGCWLLDLLLAKW
ncbi:MAG TPA: hypothetical protein VEL76_02695 [Gemmataceae bacterium]|nr:hypothetical protein [Gemmataceae bacterium]